MTAADIKAAHAVVNEIKQHAGDRLQVLLVDEGFVRKLAHVISASKEAPNAG